MKRKPSILFRTFSRFFWDFDRKLSAGLSKLISMRLADHLEEKNFEQNLYVYFFLTFNENVRQNCRNCILRVPINNLKATRILWKNSYFKNFFDFKRNIIRLLVKKKVTAGFSKLHSTCPDEQLAVSKNIFSKRAQHHSETWKQIENNGYKNALFEEMTLLP